MSATAGNETEPARHVGGAGEPFSLSPGLIVALIGPDGVGKSSQAERLTTMFGSYAPCINIYLGSGEGGWKFRRAVKRYFHKLRPPKKPSSRQKDQAAGREFGTSYSLFTGLSGLAAAIERYVTLRRAMRLAANGSVVISDRWPQDLQPGFFDGPLRLHPQASYPVRLISRLERFLYQRMAAHKPDLMIHLLADFETSTARKPGDRTSADFDQRLALMEDMRKLDPGIRIVDARKQFDEVTNDLFECVRRELMQRSAHRTSPQNTASLRNSNGNERG